MAMPTATRRYQLQLLMNENRSRQEYHEDKIKHNASTGKGTRTSSISGDTLKAKMKSGEINI